MHLGSTWPHVLEGGECLPVRVGSVCVCMWRVGSKWVCVEGWECVCVCVGVCGCGE